MQVVREIIDAVNRRDAGSVAHHPDPEMHVVLREGRVRGSHYFVRFFEAQYDQFEKFEIEIEEAFEVGDDTLVVCVTVDRHNEGADGIRMWPAQVLRFDDQDRLVSSEGYPRQDDALA